MKKILILALLSGVTSYGQMTPAPFGQRTIDRFGLLRASAGLISVSDGDVFDLGNSSGFNFPFSCTAKSTNPNGNVIYLSLEDVAYGALVTYPPNGSGPARFVFYNVLGYSNGEPQGVTEPFFIDLGNGLCTFNVGVILPAIPTDRSSAAVGQLYVEGTNETVKIRLME